MSSEFRELLKKIGSGAHTHKNLTFDEASLALEMMFKEVATPAQIGAFLIAHRIKRPTAEELGGMLNRYNKSGAVLSPIQNNKPLTILGIPYDGRTRTAPISPLTALMLSAMNVPVLMHGGDSMPTKYGLTLVEIWQSLDVDLTKLSVSEVDNLLATTNFGFLYLPQHYPLAYSLVTYREQIGKRPPLATLELIWHPYEADSHIMAGYVHPPTENMIRGALQRNEKKKFTLIKGMEGSGDLKRSQTNIISIDKADSEEGFAYLKVNHATYDLAGNDPVLEDQATYFNQLKETIAGKPTQLTESAILNGAFYLWRCDVTETIEDGLTMAENLLSTGKLQQQLEAIKNVII